MKLLVCLLVVACAALVQCDQCVWYDGDFQYTWYCTFSCCYDYAFCCLNYWYAWTGGALFLLCCLSALGACGGYRYRRYYVVRRTYQPVGGPTVITTAQTGTYQPQAGYGGNTGYAPPPAYK